MTLATNRRHDLWRASITGCYPDAHEWHWWHEPETPVAVGAANSTAPIGAIMYADFSAISGERCVVRLDNARVKAAVALPGLRALACGRSMD